MLCIDKTGTLTEPGLRLLATEVVTGRAGAPVAEVIGALAAAALDAEPVAVIVENHPTACRDRPAAGTMTT